MLQEDSTNPWEEFSVSGWLWKCLPCKKLSRGLKKWSSVGKRSGEMTDEGKLCSTICSTFEVLVVQRVVSHCHAAELGPFC